MVFRRSAVGRSATLLALLMLAGSAAAAPGPLADPPAWAAAPTDRWQPPARHFRAVPPVTPEWRAVSRGVPHYRWRPLDGARGMPPPRPSWRSAHLPPHPQARPVAGAAYPWPTVPPPRFAGWRGDGPVTVTVGGYPYRFRPLAPRAFPAVAFAPSWQGLAAVARRPGSLPPPAFTAEPHWRPMPVAWSTPPSLGQPQLQPVDLRAPEGRFAYRFRPDARFGYGAAGRARTGPSPGWAGGGAVAARSGEGGRWVWVPDASERVAPPTAVAVARAIN